MAVNDIKCMVRKNFPDLSSVHSCLQRVMVTELGEKKVFLRNNTCHHPPCRICGQKRYIKTFFYKFFCQRGDMRGFTSRPYLCGDEKNSHFSFFHMIIPTQAGSMSE